MIEQYVVILTVIILICLLWIYSNLNDNINNLNQKQLKYQQRKFRQLEKIIQLIKEQETKNDERPTPPQKPVDQIRTQTLMHTQEHPDMDEIPKNRFYDANPSFDKLADTISHAYDPQTTNYYML